MTEVLGLLIALPVVTVCVVIVYTLAKNSKKAAEPALTPRDLEVLQESAEEMVQSILSAADDTLRRFEAARGELEGLITRAEKAAEFLEARLGAPEKRKPQSLDKAQEVERLSLLGTETAEIARQLDMGSGEVELLLSLRPKLQGAH